MAVIGAGFVAGTIAGFRVSVEVGRFGFQDSFRAPYATSSLILEGVAVVVLAAAWAARQADAGMGASSLPAAQTLGRRAPTVGKAEKRVERENAART
jgi:hypothetical protein